MPPVSDWSTTAASNTSVGGVNIAEGCPAANTNNADRAIMAEAKTKFNSIDASITAIGTPQPSDATLTAIAALTTAANKLIYATGSDAFATTDLTAFARTLLDDADAATACATLGAVRVAALSLANPGYLKLQLPTGYFMVAWGTCTIAANTTTPITYAAPFPTASFALVNAIRQAGGAQDNDGGVIACSTTGCTVYSASDTSNTGFYLAAGY